MPDQLFLRCAPLTIGRPSLFIQNRTTYSAAKLIQLVVSCLSAIAPKIIFRVVTRTTFPAHLIDKTPCARNSNRLLRAPQFSAANTSSPWQAASVKGESQSPEGITPWWRVPFRSNTQSACPSWSIVMEGRLEESPKTSALALFHS